MTLVNAECSHTLAIKTNAKLNIIKLWVAKIKGGWIKQRPVAK